MFKASSRDSWGSPPNSASNLGFNTTLVGIIAGVVSGVVVLVLLLLFYRGKVQKLKENSNVEPFFISPQNYTPPSFSSKFSRRREIADAAGASVPTLPPVIGLRTNPAIRNSDTDRPLLMQPSASGHGQGGDFGFLQYADSGVRMPNEFPPAYS